jgi:hypothetical protein
MRGWVGRRETPLGWRRLLGLVLRTLCEASGLGTHGIAARTEHDPTWVAKVMRGDLSPHPNEVRVLLAAVGMRADSPAGRAIVTVARQAYGRERWWRPYGPVVPEWFARYLGLESEVAGLRVFDCRAVPELLQTPEYARALLRADRAAGPRDEVERRVALRLARQEVLVAAAPPRLEVVLDESVLRRSVGGDDVMRGQFARLLAVGERPNVRIRVLPFGAGAHLLRGGSFTVLDFPKAPAPLPAVVDPGLVFVELLGGAEYLEHEPALAAYRGAWTRLERAALEPLPSRSLLVSGDA